jgi:DNA-binding CsgD family transcriptional regulator
MFRTTILEDRMPKRKSPQLPLEQYEPGQYPPGEFVRTEEYPDGVHVRADGKPDPRKGKLTNRQMTFAKLIVEGIYSNAECARRAGFTDNTAREYARKLLDGQHFPHVVEYITELREERQRRYGVTTIGQLERLAKLSKGAEDAGQFSAAINAEKIRSAMGGLTIDRRETINTLDQLSRDEITARLAALQQKYPQAFQIEAAPMKDITPNEPAKGPFATLFCSFSGFGIDRSGPKTLDRGPRPKVRGPWVDVGGPARRGAWTLCADRALRAVNLGPARGCPAPCAPFLLLIIEKRPEIRGPRAGGRALSGDGRGLAINGSGVSLLSPLRKCRKGRMLRAIRRMRLSLQSA